MTIILKILTVLFGFAVALSGALAALKPEKKRLFILLSVVFAAAAAITRFWRWMRERGERQRSHEELLEQIQNPKGALLPKATLEGFQKELEEAAEGKKSDAEKYFQAGEQAYKSHDYGKAVDNYRQSAEILPTMSALLNQGNSLLNTSAYESARSAYRSGLEIAEEKDASEYKGAFLGNIGIVYKDQGKLKQALESFQQALEIHHRIGNLLGEANALGNIGIVYGQQGELNQALDYHQQALEIDRGINNPLGEARDRSNIGIVYKEQGELGQALVSHQQALKIHRGISNPLGEANALGNIGLVCKMQGKLEQSLKRLRRAREIFIKIGARGEGFSIVESAIREIEEAESAP